MKAPRFPAIFIVPETTPAFSFPISIQNAHDGLKVISAPKTARARNIIEELLESERVTITIPKAANPNPIIEGKRRDSFNLPLRYIASTIMPKPVTCCSCKKRNGCIHSCFDRIQGKFFFNKWKHPGQSKIKSEIAANVLCHCHPYV